MAKIHLCRVDDLPRGEILRVESDGLPPVAVFNLGGAYFAIDDTCSHGQASLADGEIDGGLVECPFHGGCFDIRTGLPAGAPCTEPVARYDLVVEDDAVYALVEP